MRRAVASLAILSVLLLPLPALAAPSSSAPEDLVQELDLENGMRFLLVERHQSPTVACIVLFGVGAADEPRGRTGMAHLLEHLLFKGTARLGTADYKAEGRALAAIERTMDAIDAERARLERASPRGVLERDPAPASPELERLTAGYARLESEMRQQVIKNEIWGTYDRHGGSAQNAFTTLDLTAYFVVLPSNQLEVWARIESERLSGSVLREFYSERSVVQEERRTSRESTPGGLINEAVASTAFTSHPYKNPVIGWMSDLEHLRRADVLEFYRTYYLPANAVGVLAGDIEPAAASRLIERTFGRLPSRPVERPRRPAEPPMSGRRERVIEFDAAPELELAFRVPAVAHPDFPALDVLASLLGDGRTARLRKRLLLEAQAVRSVRAGVASLRDPWVLDISAQPLAGHPIAEVEAMAWEEIGRLAREPATADELESIKKRARADAVFRLESNASLGLWLGQHELRDGDWREGYRYLDRLDAVTAEDVMRVAAAYLTPANEIRVELRRPEAALAAGGSAR